MKTIIYQRTNYWGIKIKIYQRTNYWGIFNNVLFYDWYNWWFLWQKQAYIYTHIKPRNMTKFLLFQTCLRKVLTCKLPQKLVFFVTKIPKTVKHLFFHCEFSKHIWSFFNQCLDFHSSPPTVASILTTWLPSQNTQFYIL